MSYNPSDSAETLSRSKKKRISPLAVILIWIILIGAGGTGAYMYSNHLKETMLLELDAAMAARTEAMRTEYSAQLDELAKEVDELESQVQSFNELLEFTKDNTTSKTDNSNQLYTQLSQVQKQLAELQKKMDLLK
ncbi:hypothetical protein [Paenibacillus brevis]|uniref:Uncharacterized protein n=1 Tax=Paenibacillus brevis TaxID=2841508 RepID=A0ABS6FRB5_9BACL|nr:hypothetical protein [Paenibacillus brevis]MBU5671987.1 hypothetical protein [Paenibacillus brevis]